jgi:hypothetical protein
MNKKELIIFLSFVGGMVVMGTPSGGGFTFLGLGLIIWVIWRGRKLEIW